METAVSNMKRGLMIGSGGSGKTTFALKLAAKTGLPLIHLDALYWQSGWQQPDPGAWKKTVTDLIAQNTWIMEGNFGGTLELRLARADYVFIFDIPNWICLWNVLKWRIKYARIFGRTRPGMAPGCPEKIDLPFLMWIWNYPRLNKPRVLKAIETFKNQEATVVVFKSFDGMEQFLAEL